MSVLHSLWIIIATHWLAVFTNVRPRVLLGELNGNTLTLYQSEGSGVPPSGPVQLQLNENLSNPRAGIALWKAVVVTDDDRSLVGDQWATWIGKTN